MKNLEHILPILKQAGLNEKEITLYTKSLQMGPQRSSKLCQYTSINRNTAQYTCQQLVQKRLMTVCPEKNSFVFTAEPPEKLLFLLEEEKRVFNNREQSLSQAVEFLKTFSFLEASLPTVKYYEGAEGIIDMYQDVIKENKPIYVATKITEDADPIVSKYIKTIYQKERAKLKNPAWALFNDNQKTQEYRKNDAKVNRISLLVPTDNFPFDTCLHIYGKKIAFYSYKQGETSGVIIENIAIRNTMLSLFKMSWNMARKLPENKSYSDILI